MSLTENFDMTSNVKEAYLLSWAYILGHVPNNVLSSHVDKVFITSDTFAALRV